MYYAVKQISIGLLDGEYRRHFSDLATALISLPPLPVQRSIVARLEKDLAEADALEAKFKQLTEAAEAEFKAELRETFESGECRVESGECEADGQPEASASSEASGSSGSSDSSGSRISRASRISRTSRASRTSSTSSLASAWPRVKLGEVCENLDSKRIPITKSDRKPGVYPYYGASGIVDWVSEYIFDGSYLLVSEDGANLLARTTPIAFAVSGKIWVNNHAHVLKFADMATQKYVEYYFESINIAAYVTGTAQPKLTQKAMNEIPLYLPPLPVQRSLVARLDAAKARCENLKNAAERGAALAAEMRKAILKEAFE